MQGYILKFGAISGLLVITPMIIGMVAGGQDSFAGGQAFGYTLMLVAFSLIFMAIKRYRDKELGGVIRFGQAFLLGLGIAAVAGVAYVSVWELFLYTSDYAFVSEYSESLIAAERASGADAARMAEFEAQVAATIENYGKVWFRVPITFSEIFPVGAIVSLISAAILRKPGVLPA